MMMVVFSYLYYHLYIATDAVEADLLEQVVDLHKTTKLRIFQKIGELLVVDGVLNADGLQDLLPDSLGR